MWFIGLVIGAIIGSIGDGQGAVVGALIGAAIGWALAEKLKAGGEDRLARLGMVGMVSGLTDRKDVL